MKISAVKRFIVGLTFASGLCLVLSSTLGAYDITTGLVAKWGFDGTTNDDSGNGNHAVLVNGAGYGTGTNYQCLMPGTNGASPKYATGGHGPGITNLSNQMTLSAWVKYMGTNGVAVYPGRSTILSRFSPVNIFLFDIDESTRFLRLILYSNGSSTAFYNQSSPVQFPTNRWVHVAAVYNGAVVTVYTNGLSNFGSAVIYPLATHATEDVIIGARGDNLPNYVWGGGGIDEVCIFNRALPASDIAALAAGAPLAGVTNLTNNQTAVVGSTLRGNHLSPAGIKTTRLYITNGSSEVTNMDVVFDSGATWHADPVLGIGTYSAVVITTNSNSIGFASAPLTFNLTTFSTLTTRSTRADGQLTTGGILFGPSTTGYDGLRTNNSAGEVSWANIQVGALVALTNFTPTRWGKSAAVTNFVMPATDTTLVWPLDLPSAVTASASTTNGAILYPSRSGRLSLSIPSRGLLNPKVMVTLRPLAGGSAYTVYDGSASGDPILLDLPTSAFERNLTPGAYIIEVRLRPVSRDDTAAVVTRQLLLVAK